METSPRSLVRRYPLFRVAFSESDFSHSEMPFFWRVNSNRCIEGVIDLAFFQRGNAGAARTGKCLILDWKTDRVPPDNTETSASAISSAAGRLLESRQRNCQARGRSCDLFDRGRRARPLQNRRA